MELISIGIGIATVAAVLLKSLYGNHYFVPDACQQLYPYLSSHIVGQELALRQTCVAICDHLEKQSPKKPLVLSVHGPPGVGKSLTHFLLARVLYSKTPEKVKDCPGTQCPPYKVLYGMDYLAAERTEQHNLLRASILEHARNFPEALLVVEEYDKLDCPTRGMFRQLLENPQTANVSMGRSIVLLESNSGYTELHQLLRKAGSRKKVNAEDASRVLKDKVFLRWLEEGCEERTDTSKMLGLVDFFLPYFPLERDDIISLVRMQLRDKAVQVEGSMGLKLTWEDQLVNFIVDKVDFDGAYPIEGGKEVSSLITRYVSYAILEWQQQHQQATQPAKGAQPQVLKLQASQQDVKAVLAQPKPIM